MTVATAALGVVTGGIGLYEQYKGGKGTQAGYDQQARLSQGISANSARIEGDRAQQMNLDATRQQRQLYRQYITARASALSRNVSAGASGATGFQSSSFQGASSQLSSQYGDSSGNIDQNLSLGRDIFAANANIFNLQSQNASIQSDIYKHQSEIDMGKTLFGIGSSLVANSETSGKLGQGIGLFK